MSKKIIHPPLHTTVDYLQHNKLHSVNSGLYDSENNNLQQARHQMHNYLISNTYGNKKGTKSKTVAKQSAPSTLLMTANDNGFGHSNDYSLGQTILQKSNSKETKADIFRKSRPLDIYLSNPILRDTKNKSPGKFSNSGRKKSEASCEFEIVSRDQSSFVGKLDQKLLD